MAATAVKSVFLFALLALFIVGCSTGQESAPTAPTPTGDAPSDVAAPTPADELPPEPSAAPGVDGTPEPQKVVEVDVVSSQFAFTPGEIRAQQGDKVVIRLTTADVPHGLKIEGYDKSVIVDAGETGTLEFTADKKGTFRFFCNVPCGSGHRQMEGYLVVE